MNDTPQERAPYWQLLDMFFHFYPMPWVVVNQQAPIAPGYADCLLIDATRVPHLMFAANDAL